jgi:hypothetical protein
MNPKTKSTLIKLAGLTLALACLGAGAAKAQSSRYEGKFTLPFAVRWGTAVLSSGEYTFRIDTGAPPYLVRIDRPGGAAMIMPLGVSRRPLSDSSALVIARHGKGGTVRVLRLAEAGLALTYPVPKTERPLLAQEPELFQRLPVTLAAR